MNRAIVAMFLEGSALNYRSQLNYSYHTFRFTDVEDFGTYGYFLQTQKNHFNERKPEKRDERKLNRAQILATARRRKPYAIPGFLNANGYIQAMILT